MTRKVFTPLEHIDGMIHDCKSGTIDFQYALDNAAIEHIKKIGHEVVVIHSTDAGNGGLSSVIINKGAKI